MISINIMGIESNYSSEGSTLWDMERMEEQILYLFTCRFEMIRMSACRKHLKLWYRSTLL
ncbi:hypothetical protein GCWU000341_02150 [Oribacterium sp. oral taxon 078 str. F0262]|nr:hypothetical protein GCWU000341_02150 [Oribacterium sp. oral taxon 078 str. F0262]